MVGRDEVGDEPLASTAATLPVVKTERRGGPCNRYLRHLAALRPKTDAWSARRRRMLETRWKRRCGQLPELDQADADAVVHTKDEAKAAASKAETSLARPQSALHKMKAKLAKARQVKLQLQDEQKEVTRWSNR